MYLPFKSIHNIIGMIVLLFVLIALITFIVNSLRRKPVSKSAKIIALIALIVTHLQILIGFVLYFLSPLGVKNFSGETMKHTVSRFYAVEHPVGMILGAVLITIGYRALKNTKLSEKGKYTRGLIFYLLGFVITAYMIPWFLWY